MKEQFKDRGKVEDDLSKVFFRALTTDMTYDELSEEICKVMEGSEKVIVN